MRVLYRKKSQELGKVILWNRAASDSANGAINFVLVHSSGILALSVGGKENYRHKRIVAGC